MLAALRLGRSTTWRQIFTDGTARRQIAFQNLVIAVMEHGKLDPVLVSSCMVLESETSDNQVKSIMDMVSYVLWRCKYVRCYSFTKLLSLSPDRLIILNTD